MLLSLPSSFLSVCLCVLLSFLGLASGTGLSLTQKTFCWIPHLGLEHDPARAPISTGHCTRMSMTDSLLLYCSKNPTDCPFALKEAIVSGTLPEAQQRDTGRCDCVHWLVNYAFILPCFTFYTPSLTSPGFPSWFLKGLSDSLTPPFMFQQLPTNALLSPVQIS